MELLWSDSEIPLSSFVERFTLPQIVQIGEGAYGNDEETTLSRGQELNLHLVNDKQYYFGVTESGDDIYIPLNSPHKVHVYYERSLKFSTVEEKTEEPMFIAEVNQRFKLPFTIKFISSQSHLTHGIIHLQEIVNRKTIVASSRDEECQSVLTFPDTLDVTVIPPKKTTLANPEYRKLCENLNVNVNVKEIEKAIEKDDQVYEDVQYISKIDPYAECFFGKSLPSAGENSDKANTKEDKEGYVDIESIFGKNIYQEVQTRKKIMESNKKAEDLTVREIGLLLNELNLSQYRRIFEREQVDGKMLKDLKKEMLQSHFKMNAFHAHKLKKATGENWRPTVQK